MQELKKVNVAAASVNAAAEQLDQIKASADYWRTKAHTDYTRGDMSSYNTDLKMFEQAKTAYDNCFTQIYTPALINWNDLKDKYQTKFAPKLTDLEDKYGMTTGIGVGL